MNITERKFEWNISTKKILCEKHTCKLNSNKKILKFKDCGKKIHGKQNLDLHKKLTKNSAEKLKNLERNACELCEKKCKKEFDYRFFLYSLNF